MHFYVECIFRQTTFSDFAKADTGAHSKVASLTPELNGVAFRDPKILKGNLNELEVKFLFLAPVVSPPSPQDLRDQRQHRCSPASSRSADRGLGVLMEKKFRSGFFEIRLESWSDFTLMVSTQSDFHGAL